MKRLFILITLLTLPEFASAHLVSTRFGEYYNGLLHPIISLVHIIPWLGLALIAGMQKKVIARKTLWLFPLIIFISAYIGTLLPESTFINTINMLSIIVIGTLLALGKPFRQSLFVALVIIMAISHGYANSFKLNNLNQELLYLCGVASIAYITITLFAAIANRLQQQQWGNIALRALGGWIIAIGLIFTTFNVANVS